MVNLENSDATDAIMSKTNVKTDLDSPADVVKSDDASTEGIEAWLQVVGGFCLNLNTWGLMNAYGAYQTYYELGFLHDSSPSAIAWIGSLQACLMFTFSFFIGPVVDAGHLKALLTVGSTLSVVGFFMTSICHTYWQCLLAQGVTMGIGFGCLYLPAPAIISMHFDKNIGLAMGLASCGSGIGGIIFPLAFSRLQPIIGFGWAVRVQAFILLGTSIVPIAVMRIPKTTLTPKIDAKPPSSRVSISELILKVVDISALTDAPYILLALGLATGYMGSYIVLYYINLFSLERASTATSLAFYFNVIVNAASVLGRILPAALADRIGPAHVIGLTLLVAAIMVFCLFAVHTSAGVVVWSVMFGIVSGAFMGLPAAGVVSVSDRGVARIGARLGMTLLLVGIGVLIAEPVAGVILDGSGSWSGLIGWCGALLLLGALFLLASRLFKVGFALRVKI